MEFKDLKEEYIVNWKGINYKLTKLNGCGRCKESYGKKVLQNHRWYQYSVKSDNENGIIPFGYTSIVVVPQKVTEKHREDCRKYVVESGVTSPCIEEKNEWPHIDGITGNIHHKKYNVDHEKLNHHEVGQIVCAGDGHSGPVRDACNIEGAGEKDLYKYRINVKYVDNKKISILEGNNIFVPRAAYYPLYDENGKEIHVDIDDEYDCNRSKELSQFLEILWKEIVNPQNLE